jgi:DNA (cytosine-5)-methyltransferase 1
MRYLSVCSGMEAASVAWEPLGWKAVGFSEIEPFPCAILKHRFPTTPNYGSLTEYQQWPIEPGAADLLVGGTPCQSFSVAGLRKGMADPRGNLALTFLGLADRIKPRWIVWENVPGVLSSNGGRDFGAFLGALVELGYGFAYRVLDAQHFGVPQRRRRIFVVACLGDWRAAASVLFEPDCVRRHLEAGGKKRKGPAADAGSGVDESGLQRTVGTLCADTHPGAYSGQDAYTGRLIPQQKTVGTLCARDYKGVGSQYVQEGKCIPVPVPTGAQAIAIQGTIIGRGENSGPQGTGATQGGPMFTLTKTDIHGVAHTMPVSVAPVAFSFDSLASNSMKSSNPISGCREVDLAKTIDTTNPCPSKNQGGLGILQTPPMAITQSDVAGPLDAHYYKGPGSRQGGEREYVAVPPMAVRRLTPEECEKLQGFKPGWSRIPWKGKPEEQCPDGPRYKACGNSMAVPVMRWIGERIAQADQTFFPR